MPETFVIYAYVVPKPDVAVKAVDWLEEVAEFIETEDYSVE